MIRRRTCVFGSVAVALLWPMGVLGAETAKKIYRIGVLEGDSDVDAHLWKEFVAELARRGYGEGRDVVFEKRLVNDLQPELLNKFARELVALKVDVVYAATGSAGALAARNATKTIPIVFRSSLDPVGM